MRILVISDLHANWPALEAFLEAQSFDRAIVVGDLVSYGPHPREVVEWVRAHAIVMVRGNHDDALACGSDCRCAPSSKPLATATRAVHRDLLTPEDIRFLGSLPRTASLQSPGHTLFGHASPRNHLYRYTLTPQASDEHVRGQVGRVEPDYVLLGHTHLPMARSVGRRMVVNPGVSASHATVTRGPATPWSRTVVWSSSESPMTSSGRYKTCAGCQLPQRPLMAWSPS